VASTSAYLLQLVLCLTLALAIRSVLLWLSQNTKGEKYFERERATMKQQIDAAIQAAALQKGEAEKQRQVRVHVQPVLRTVRTGQC
jgi:hypothetical protein